MTEHPDFHTPGPTPGLRPPRRQAPPDFAGTEAEPDPVPQPPVAPPEPPAGRGRRSRPSPRLLALVLIAVAALAGLGVWLAVRGGGSSSSPVPKSSPAVPISVQGLRTLARLGIPIYWAGERPGMTYELTKTEDNKVFIRYLPAGVQIGTTAQYLTIATYPMQNAFNVTSGLAGKNGSVKVDVGNGGVAFYNEKTPTNVYVAYPASNAQIEVYDPSAAEAQRIVASNEVARVR